MRTLTVFAIWLIIWRWLLCHQQSVSIKIISGVIIFKMKFSSLSSYLCEHHDNCYTAFCHTLSHPSIYPPTYPHYNAPGELMREKCVCGFSTVDNISLLNLEGTGMIGVPGIAQRLFGKMSHSLIKCLLLPQQCRQLKLELKWSVIQLLDNYPRYRKMNM